MLRGDASVHTVQIAHDEAGDCSDDELAAINHSQTLMVSVV